MSRIRIASIIVTIVAGALLVLDTLNAWDRWPQASRGVHDGAVVTPVIAALFWLVGTARKRREDQISRIDAAYRRREAALIKTVSRLDVPTKPLPRLHSVHS